MAEGLAYFTAVGNYLRATNDNWSVEYAAHNLEALEA